jgi:hypothetical protein
MHTPNADTITGNVTTQPLPLSAVRIPDHLPLPSCLRPAALLLGRLHNAWHMVNGQTHSCVDSQAWSGLPDVAEWVRAAAVVLCL